MSSIKKSIEDFINVNHDNAYNEYIVPYTKHLYKKLLEKVEKGVTIVDIGIGNGEALLCDENVKIIKKKFIQIYGYDIDNHYLDRCDELIKEKGLQYQVFCIKKDFTKDKILFSQTAHYLYFSNSYSVIKEPKKLIKNVIQYFNPITIVISLTLSDNYIDYILKPASKYFMWGVNFGRVITEDKFLEEMNESELKVEKKELSYTNETMMRTFNIFTFYLKQKHRKVQKI